MTNGPTLGAPKFYVRKIRYPEDEVSLYVKWTQFYLVYATKEDPDVVRGMMDDALAWCTDQFGPIDPMVPRWQLRRAIICILSDTDSAAFRMRWC